MSEQWRMQLNNYVQRNGLNTHVSWSQPTTVGPQHAPTWSQSVFFQGHEYGHGCANNLSSARELAAEMALRALWLEHSEEMFNDYAERHGLMLYVFWSQPVPTGPQDASRWSISLFINQVEYGHGSGENVDIARKRAAQMALSTLQARRQTFPN